METGKHTQRCDEVAGLLAIYGVIGDERQELLQLTQASDRPGLWQRHSSSLAQRIAILKILEARATSLINFECELIPGLLQTVPYARAVLRDVGLVDDEELLGDQVAARIQRQAVLRKPGAPEYTAIIAENALHNLIGDKKIMRDQLAYLNEVTQRPNVQVRVIPRSAGAHPGLDGPFLRLQFPDRPGVVMLGNRTTTLFLEDDEDRLAYTNALVELLSMALDPAESLALVRDIETYLAQEQL